MTRTADGMENTRIDWTRHFDRAYCISHVTSRARRKLAEAEFRRVGLLDSGIFQWCITYPDPWERKLLEAYPQIGYTNEPKTRIAFLNLGLASCRLMREAAESGYRRVLFLEDDIRFLKDLGAISAAFDDIPADFDIVQFDKFAQWEVTKEAYAALCRDRSVNAHYFDATGGFWMSGGCFMATARGMANMLKFMEERRPGPMDGAMQRNGNRHAAAKRNLAVQVMMTDAACLRYMGQRNTHHLAYAPQGVKYEDYAVPEGYGYGSLYVRLDLA